MEHDQEHGSGYDRRMLLKIASLSAIDPGEALEIATSASGMDPTIVAAANDGLARAFSAGFQISEAKDLSCYYSTWSLNEGNDSRKIYEEALRRAGIVGQDEPITHATWKRFIAQRATEEEAGTALWQNAEKELGHRIRLRVQQTLLTADLMHQPFELFEGSPLHFAHTSQKQTPQND